MATAFEAYQAKLRSEFGLSSDLPTIRLADASGADSNDLHIPLLPVEAAELESRQPLYLLGSQAQDRMRGVGGWGGVWIDQKAGGILHLLHTRDITDSQFLVRLSLPLSGVKSYVLDTVDYGYDKLETVMATVSADIPRWAESGTQIAGVGIDDQHNDVIVNVVDPSDEQSAQLKDAYGDVISVVAVDHLVKARSNRNISIGKLYGGEWITGPTEFCSAGYGYMRNSAGQVYAVTAGHCGPNGSSWVQGLGNTGRKIGTVHGNTVSPNATTVCDCAFIGPLPSGYATNQVLVSNNRISRHARLGRKPAMLPTRSYAEVWF